MFSNFGGVTKEVGQVVISTGIPLSQRFRAVPKTTFAKNVNPVASGSHIPGFGANFNVRGGANPSVGLREFNPLTRGSGISKGSRKDAQIQQLENKLRLLEMQIKTGSAGAQQNTSRGHFTRNSGQSGNIPRIPRSSLLSRFGPSIFAKGQRGNVGKNMSPLNVERVLRDPRPSTGVEQRNQKRAPRKGKFFGTPKTRTDLDAELDSYMAQSKTGMRSKLDRELDLMQAARSQLQTAAPNVSTETDVVSKRGADTTPSPVIAAEHDDMSDTEMEIAE